MLLSMNLNAVDVALNEFACSIWMLLSMNLHAVDVALNKLECRNVDVALNEFARCGCCSQ